MSTPTVPVGTGSRIDDVGTYVAAVRSRLDDLTPDEVEELTGGLEADLSEALAGTGEGPRQRFGDPAEYADELRSAAGLAPRPGGGDRGGVRESARAIGSALRANGRAITGAPGYAPVRDFLVVLRPAWWVLRAWVAYMLVLMVLGANGDILPGGVLGLLLLGAAIVVSVQLGVRSPLPRREARVLIVLGNVWALLLIPLVLDNVAKNDNDYDGGGVATDGMVVEQDGLRLDGEQVFNIFPYDAQGRPLRDVRLYDDRGRALAQNPDASTYWDDGDVNGDGAGKWGLVPRSGIGPDQPRNVYPLLRQPIDPNYGTPSQQPEDAKLPFDILPPLFAVPAPSASATPSPSATPSASATPEPSEPPGTAEP